jgi:hypothetical protein
LKRIAPKRFSKYAFVPSVGASGGILLGWNDAIFKGEVNWCQDFAITVNFISRHTNQKWKLTIVYGPCHGERRDMFVQWLYDLHLDSEEDWMLVGDFNFYRSSQDRNRGRGNYNDMEIFNSIISHHGLMEIPLKGRNFTWSNMQETPLLEQLDWCFTSLPWTSSYPNTLMLPLAKTLSDHTPCLVQIGTSIPKTQIFRIENHWFMQPGFMDVVKDTWESQVQASNTATKIATKFKVLRRNLKNWSKGISRLSNLIQICNETVLILDKLEEQRNLHHTEWNLRRIVKEQIKKLLKCKNEYRRQRYTIRWVQLGDEPTKFFHAAATERYRRNTISILQTEDGREVSSHAEKAASL